MGREPEEAGRAVRSQHSSDPVKKWEAEKEGRKLGRKVLDSNVFFRNFQQGQQRIPDGVCLSIPAMLSH